MSERGTIKVDRGVFEHPRFAAEPFTEIQAWLWMLAEATFRRHTTRIGAATVHLERGQFAHSVRFLATKWRWTKSTVHRFLTRLKEPEGGDGPLIGTEIARGLTIVTICNYELWQSSSKRKRRDVGQQTGHSRDRGEGKESIRADSATARACAGELADEVCTIFGFDPQFVPPEWIGLAYWLEQGLRGGWKADLVRIAARKVAAKRKGSPPGSFRYLGPVIADAHALAAAPPPQATVHKMGGAKNGKRTVQDATRELAERLARDSEEREQRSLNLLRSFNGS